MTDPQQRPDPHGSSLALAATTTPIFGQKEAEQEKAEFEEKEEDQDDELEPMERLDHKRQPRSPHRVTQTKGPQRGGQLVREFVRAGSCQLPI
jgi:hypothetical protein